MKLSHHQQQILARLAEGWTLAYRDGDLEFRNGGGYLMQTPDRRALNGLKHRGMVTLAPPNVESNFYEITEAGQAALRGGSDHG